MPEVGAARAGGEHEVVVTQAFVIENDLFVLRIELGDFTEQNLHIELPANQLA